MESEGSLTCCCTGVVEYCDLDYRSLRFSSLLVNVGLTKARSIAPPSLSTRLEPGVTILLFSVVTYR